MFENIRKCLDFENDLWKEILKQTEKTLLEQKVADCTFAKCDFDLTKELKKMQQVLDDHTQVLLCSPNTKEKLLNANLPVMCEFIVSNAVPDEEVYLVTDKEMKNQWLKAIRGEIDDLWFMKE